jgi:oligoribonuclease NrnB/cAMP/cGMP phosphodiesterase (DHH superfamily)
MTALGLNKFSWACIQPDLIPESFRDAVLYGTESRPVHSSGTSLVYDYLEYCGYANKFPNRELAKYLTFLIAGYDTWDWVNVFEKDQRFRDLQTLFMQYGIEEFETAFTERISDPEAAVFNDTDQMLLRIAQSKRKHFLEEVVAHRIRTGNIRIEERYYSLAYCTVSENMPDVFEYMRANYDVDICMIDYGTGVSMRTNKPDVSIAEIAKRVGGGGHPGAGGVRIPFEKRQTLLEDVLKASIYFD